MVKKYKLTKKSIKIAGHILYRIKALRDIPSIGIKAGDLGGFIEKESNLNHTGECWVFDNARIYDCSLVCDNAKILKNAEIFGNARICGNSVVTDDAKCFDNATIYDNALISDSAKVYGHASISDNVSVYDNVNICGFSHVYGRSRLFDNVFVCDNAKVYNIIACGDKILNT